jgi:predicted NUDIX family phosphoesterase
MAYRALMSAKKPLTPHEMLEIARASGFLPGHLFGATMHRTLSARLSEHIRRDSASAVFFRTGPSQFFLCELALTPNVPKEFTKVYRGHLRSKAIRKENVLVAPRKDLATWVFGEYTPYDEEQFQKLYSELCFFTDRERAEGNNALKQFVTFTLVFHERKLLTYRRGKFTTTSDLLKGQRSVGFGGHVNDRDFDLFHRGGDAFRANAARELKEELFLDEVYREQRDAMDRSRILGYVNVDDSADAEHHIAVLVSFEHADSSLPKKGELSINQLSWLDLDRPVNDLSDFDLWSGMILKNIYRGRFGVS